MRTKLSLMVATGTLLTACGGAKDDRTVETFDYSRIKPTPQTVQALQLADEATVKQHIANGLRLQLSRHDDVYYGGSSGSTGSSSGAAAPEFSPVTADKAGRSLDSTGYSGTNVHVQGVDEADTAKYDGKHWFIANHPQYDAYRVGIARPSIQVVATDPVTPHAEIVGQLQLDEFWGSIGEMYLVQQTGSTTHVASVRNRWGNVMPYLPGMPVELQVDVAEPAQRVASLSALPYWHEPVNSKVLVQLLDVSTPSMPTADWQVEVDGSLIDSRKVGNTLYLITRYDPWLAGLTPEYGDTSIRELNEAVLSDTPLEQLLPHYYTGDSKAPLSADCYLQARPDEYHGYGHLVNITAIDLASQSVVASTCLNSSVEAMSMSSDNLYLTGTVYDHQSRRQQTVVHKFALTEQGAQYAATGSVDGSLGWRSDPAFRMHEAGDQLRIVTSDQGRDGPEHRLTILEDAGGALAAISTLPNDSQPAAIGKPGEDIYSVRFEGNMAYIVTFQQTDPLYAIDLSDPLAPYIAGELEIPGFATYMHPLGNDYLFTLGQDADENGRALGIKAELIRVTDGTPEVVNTVLLGGRSSQSEALHNLRALSVLAVSDDEVRFAFPVIIYEDGYQSWQYSGLQLLQVDGLSTAEVQLVNQGTIITERRSDQKQYPEASGTMRGILHDDAAFFTFNRGIWAARWDSPENAVGPIHDEPIACTTEFVYGLHITVTLADGSEADPCNAMVTAAEGDTIEVLMPINSREGASCTFYGAGESPGSYVVAASMPGRQNAVAKAEVYRDECHVIPEKLELVLTETE